MFAVFLHGFDQQMSLACRHVALLMRGLSHYFEKFSHYYEKLSHYYEKVSHYEKISHYYAKLSHNYEKVSHYYDLQNHIFSLLWRKQASIHRSLQQSDKINIQFNFENVRNILQLYVFIYTTYMLCSRRRLGTNFWTQWLWLYGQKSKDIFQINITLCVPQKKESHTGLERH